ncbi:ABC transporter substrate-binding protein [Rhodococcus baikonurensis]|uniref:ABC transporter substrate-binding protein n=1 Tax=Rhodococcus baikonurensis TaxID=172041 RepID=A0ABV5XP38_9NOCA
MSFGRHAFAAVIVVAMFTLSACGGVRLAESIAVEGPSGDPVSGGIGRMIELAEPRSLDPALIANSYANSPLLGNALYGTLMINNIETGAIEYKMAENFFSTDGGKTFTLVLRDGLTFSDESPFTAQSVKTAWEHVKDPATASPDIPQARMIESTAVEDDRTLSINLVEPIPSFANAILQTSLNWIASPETLAADQAHKDSNPIGAGPYTLESWSRQDVIRLARNENYYDAPRPYLKRLEIRAIPDAEQRYNTLLTGGADLALEGSWQNVDKARNTGLQSSVVKLGGGTALVLNNTKAPFNDPRARKALATALNLDMLNTAVYEGTAKIPTHLFDESSPFYTDIPLAQQNHDEAQRLLDELASEGKPLEFTLSLYPTGRSLGEAVQTQMSVFDNVTVKVRSIDLAQVGRILGQKDYDVISSTVVVSDPEPRLWFGFHSTSSGNFSGVSDPQLDEALDRGRVSQDETERVAAYAAVQKRLAELNPVVFYTRAAPAVIANGDVGGIVQYGMGSVLPEDLWIQG